MPEVPPGAIAFTCARPPEEFFPVEEFRSCCNAVLRSDGRRSSAVRIDRTDTSR